MIRYLSMIMNKDAEVSGTFRNVIILEQWATVQRQLRLETWLDMSGINSYL